METLICNLFLKHTKMSKNRRKHRPRQQHLTKKNSNTLRMTWVRSHVPLECLKVIIFRCLQLSFHKNLFFLIIPKHFTTHTITHSPLACFVSYCVCRLSKLSQYIVSDRFERFNIFSSRFSTNRYFVFTFIPMFNLHILSNSHSSSLHATLLPFRTQFKSFLF